jgi:hypothetical protein
MTILVGLGLYLLLLSLGVIWLLTLSKLVQRDNKEVR